MNITEGINNVNLHGLLVENSLVANVSKKNGKNYIGGNLIVEVKNDASVADGVSQVPVNFFAFEFKKDGNPNKIYQSLASVMNNYKSAAEVGRENADYVSITGGRIEENFFFTQDLRFISTFRISSNFVNRAKEKELGKGTFEVETYINSIDEEEDPINPENSRLVIVGLVPNFFGRVYRLRFYVDGEKAQNYVNSNYSPGDTVKLGGELVNRQIKTTYTEEMEFGEDIVRTYTNSRKELVAIQGSAPFEETTAWKEENIKAAAQERQNEIDRLKQEKESQQSQSQTQKLGDDIPF